MTEMSGLGYNVLNINGGFTMDILNILKGYEKNSIGFNIAAGEDFLPGCTRFGGQPDVPPDFVWPEFNGKPLAFLAQFDCAALTELDADHLLPDHGLLSFFYELETQRWGFDPEDKGCCRVFWFEDVSSLVPAEFPTALKEEFRLPGLGICAFQQPSFPYDEDFDQLCPEAGFSEAAWDAAGGQEEEHRLLGWPNTIQGSMPVECDVVSQGYWMGGGGDPHPPIPDEVLANAMETAGDRWTLLLQLGHVTYGDRELMFGDMGRIYFYIQKEDLAARRFDKVWLVLQCY